MIKHIVFFRLLPGLREAGSADLLEEVSYQLGLLPAIIPGILNYEIHLNIAADPKAADLVLVSEFSDMDALQAYQVHPAHLAFVEWNRNKCPKMAVADYEC